MSDSRRTFIKQSLAFTVGILLAPFACAGWPVEKFAALRFPESLSRLLGGQDAKPTDKIQLKLPLIAENGAVVPVNVSSTLEKVESIAILVEKNPVPLAAQFDLTPECEASVSARIKMAETSDVIAIVKAGGHYYRAQQRVKVTIGGCGG